MGSKRLVEDLSKSLRIVRGVVVCLWGGAVPLLAINAGVGFMILLVALLILFTVIIPREKALGPQECRVSG